MQSRVSQQVNEGCPEVGINYRIPGRNSQPIKIKRAIDSTIKTRALNYLCLCSYL